MSEKQVNNYLYQISQIDNILIKPKLDEKELMEHIKNIDNNIKELDTFINLNFRIPNKDTSKNKKETFIVLNNHNNYFNLYVLILLFILFIFILYKIFL